MRRLFYVIIICLTTSACTKERINIQEESLKSRFTGQNFRKQFEEIVQRGAISKIGIQNIKLQRVSSGVTQTIASYAYDYCPQVAVFELSERNLVDESQYTIGLRKGGPGGDILDVEVTLSESTSGEKKLVVVNGLTYTIELHRYAEGEESDEVEYTFSPVEQIPGTSEDYTSLIAALNLSNNGDVNRPELPIPDMRVLSLEHIRLTFILDKQKSPFLSLIGSCESVLPSNGLYAVGSEEYRYESAGGATIRMVSAGRSNLTILLGYKPYDNFTIEFWGRHANPGELSPTHHENLNGKHLKDRFGTNRTVIFPDGTKITLESTGPESGGIKAITIYDGGIVHHLNMDCGKVEISTFNSLLSKRMDEQQADGETSTFELTTEGLIYYNVYEEESPCHKVYKRVDMGRLKKEFPKLIEDLFDDPRLSHT